MGFVKRRSTNQQAAEQAQAAEALHERAMRLVDTRGVVVREAEAELQAAIAELRSYPTPASERRVAEATQALDEARRTLLD
jgi:hypothetical protein